MTEITKMEDDSLSYEAALLAELEQHEKSRQTSTSTSTGEVLIKLDNIHKTYLLGVEGVAALRGVSLEVFKGEWLVIYGTSGGGKTTLLNILGTIDKPTKGEMFIGGTLVNSETSDSMLASVRLCNLGFVFQSFNLLSAMTARENVELPMVLRGELGAGQRKHVATESLQKMGLHSRLDHYPNMLSGGEQQRVTIARAIANKPQLLLLDEPTGDLDSKNTDIVIRMLEQLNREEEMTLVMVTHDIYLKNFAHRVIWMRDGKISKIETISERAREEALKQLNQTSVEISDVSKVNLSSSSTQTETVKIEEKGWEHTEIRDPKDYRMFHQNPKASSMKLKGKFETSSLSFPSFFSLFLQKKKN